MRTRALISLGVPLRPVSRAFSGSIPVTSEGLAVCFNTPPLFGSVAYSQRPVGLNAQGEPVAVGSDEKLSA
jgi:hypothetical protein